MNNNHFINSYELWVYGLGSKEGPGWALLGQGLSCGHNHMLAGDGREEG